MAGGVTELSPPSLVGSLLPCVICNRTFLPEALSRHQIICQKTANKKRMVFNSSHQRLQGTGIDPEVVHRSPSPPPRRRSTSRSSWREKHSQLLNTVRSARGTEPATPAAAAPPPDYEQCPFCARHFGPKAADRHISWCKEQKSRLPGQRQEAAVAKGRLNARTKYVAPLPLKPRPKRVSADRLSREASPAMSVSSAPASGTPGSTSASTAASSNCSNVKSPVRVARDYAKEYRERTSQEREQRIMERKKSPAAISSGYGKLATAGRQSREGSEPLESAPRNDSFRRTQSFRARPAAAGRTAALKNQRTGKRPGAAELELEPDPEPVHQVPHHHQQKRDEPDGGEDVAPDRHNYNYQSSSSTPSQRLPSPARVLPTFSPGGDARRRSGSPSAAPAPEPAAPDEVYITRSELNEYQRLNDAVKQTDAAQPDAAHSEEAPSTSSSSQLTTGAPPSLGELDASVTSDGEGADTYRVTSSQTRRRLQKSGARKSGRSLAGNLELTGKTLQISPRKEKVDAQMEKVDIYQERGKQEKQDKPTSARVRPARRLLNRAAAGGPGSGGGGGGAEKAGQDAVAAGAPLPPPRDARTPDEVFADSLEDLITVTECPVFLKPAAVRTARPRGRAERATATAAAVATGDGPVSASVSLPALAPAPQPRPRPRPRRGAPHSQRVVLPPLESRSGPPTGRSELLMPMHPPAPPARSLHTRRQSAAPASFGLEPVADEGPASPGWTHEQWRPINSGGSSNRSSVERGGGSVELQFSRLAVDDSSSPSGSLYEAEMPDFDLIMEEARRASERKAAALSPRKARMRGLDMRQMMGVEVVDMNLKNSAPPTQKFCHECGSGYPVRGAKFCCNCGAQRLI